ncbi:hypothetical protein GCM10023189_19970 [Nibrella saemangeumensis]|uniref:SprB repeat-containing protein n=2 Tax=Nibrella saemangeumensis TaxID=1084526 RepID=A0ABP8MS97_9BACT
MVGLFGHVTSSYAQGPVTSCDGCNAKEVSISGARLIPPPTELNCTPGNPVSATLAVTVTANDNVKRYSIYLSATLKVGNTETVVDFCSPQSFSKSTEFYIPVTWTCGAEVEIGNVFLAWGVKKADNICAGGFTCNNIVKSKCAKSTQIISVAEPLVANFTSATACVGTTPSFSVTATATGGTKSPDGSYPSLVLDIAGTVFTATNFTGPFQAQTSIPLPPGSYPVSLTITDAAGVTDIETRTVVIGSCVEPLVADFTSSTFCIGTTQYLSLTATATGGTKTLAGAYPMGVLDAAGTTFTFTGFSGPLQATVAAPPGSYPVSFTVVDENGVTDVETKTVVVGTCPAPEPLVADFTSSTFCIGTTSYLSLTATTTGGTKTPADAYPTGILDAAGTTFTFTGYSGPLQATVATLPGTYPVSFTAVDANGITDVVTKTVVVGTCPTAGARVGVAENAARNKLTVSTYPNPHNGRVFLQINSPVDGIADIDWFTTSGSKVDALKVNVHKGVNEPVGYDVPGNNTQLIYRVNVGGSSTSGTIISGK